jgi:hypothetical protein
MNVKGKRVLCSLSSAGGMAPMATKAAAMEGVRHAFVAGPVPVDLVPYAARRERE